MQRLQASRKLNNLVQILDAEKRKLNNLVQILDTEKRMLTSCGNLVPYVDRYYHVLCNSGASEATKLVGS
jgi:hypothetical protein